MAPTGNRSAQQGNELYDESSPKQGIARLPPPSRLPVGSGDRDPPSGRTPRGHEAMMGTGEDGTQSSGREGTRRPILPKRKGLARRQEPSPALSDTQTGPQTSWPIPYHGASFTRRLSTRSSLDLDRP